MNLNDAESLSRTALVLLPEIIVALSAVAMMTAGAFVTKAARGLWSGLSALAIVAAIVALFAIRGVEPDPYRSVALNDALSFYGRLAFLLTGLILLGLAHGQVVAERAAEFFGGLLLVTAGAMLVTTANEILFLFVGLELVSIPTYLLLYLPRRAPATQEAATKYFYLSVFSSALLLFGLAYLYGLTGVSNLKALAYLMRSGGSVLNFANVAFGLVAVVFITAGLGFRVAAVPFHFYAPDVYQGAPTIVAALLAWVPKGIGFVAMLRALSAVVSVGSDLLSDRAILLAWVIALATMVLGNTVALVQDNLKRLLAYSSIAHAGYLMVGVAASFAHVPEPNAPGPNTGGEGILFYLVSYALMTLGAFGVILFVNRGDERVETIDDMSGLGQTRPLVAFAMVLLLFSLAGVPPFAGFWGKFFIFAAAWNVDPGSLVHVYPSLKLLAVLGVINAAVGAYYYLRIVVTMYYGAPKAAPATAREPGGWPTGLAVGACAALSLVVGLFPGPVLRASRSAAVAALAQPDPAPDRPVEAEDELDVQAVMLDD